MAWALDVVGGRLADPAGPVEPRVEEEANDPCVGPDEGERRFRQA